MQNNNPCSVFHGKFHGKNRRIEPSTNTAHIEIVCQIFNAIIVQEIHVIISAHTDHTMHVFDGGKQEIVGIIS